MKTDLVLTGAKLFDGAGRVVENSRVVVREGKIAEVGEAGPQNVPGDSPDEAGQVLDLAGMTLMPGIIDTHMHIMADASPNFLVAWAHDSDALLALQAVPRLRRLLRSGVTTFADGGGPRHIDLAVRDALRAGDVEGPRMLASGEWLRITRGHGHPFGRAADGPADYRREARRQLGCGVDILKLMVTGGLMTKTDPRASQIDEDEIRAAVIEAHRAGRPAQCHALGAEGVKSAVRAGIDAVAHGFYLDDEGIELMVERGTRLIPTFSILTCAQEEHEGMPPGMARKCRQALDVFAEGFRKAYKAGVEIVMGTDSGTSFNPQGNYGGELWWMTEYGMSAQDTLCAATGRAAEYLGLAHDLGTVAPGKTADLLAIEGDPLADMAVFKDAAAKRMVFQAGRLVGE